MTLMTLWNKQDGLVLNHTAAREDGRAVADGRHDDEEGGDSGAIEEEEEEEEEGR